MHVHCHITMSTGAQTHDTHAQAHTTFDSMHT